MPLTASFQNFLFFFAAETLAIWKFRQYGQISNIFAFRIWDAQLNFCDLKLWKLTVPAGDVCHSPAVPVHWSSLNRVFDNRAFQKSSKSIYALNPESPQSVSEILNFKVTGAVWDAPGLGFKRGSKTWIYNWQKEASTTERRQKSSPSRRAFLVPSKASKTCCLNVSSKSKSNLNRYCRLRCCCLESLERAPFV